MNIKIHHLLIRYVSAINTYFVGVKKTLILAILSLFGAIVFAQEIPKKLQQAKLYAKVDRPKAISIYNDILKQDSSITTAYYERGVLFFKEDSLDQAIRDFDKALQLNPDLELLHIFKGFAHRRQGDFQMAIEDFDNYIEGSDTDTLAFEYMIRGKLKMASGDLEGAFEDLNAAEEMAPLEEHLHFYKFSIKYKMGKYKEAISELNKAIELNADFYGYYYNRGNAYFNMGLFSRAFEDYETSLNMNRENADAFYRRGWVKDTLDNCSEAIIDYSLAIRLKDDNGAFYSRRGNCKYRTGNKIGACIDWETANDLGYYARYEELKKLCD